MRVRLWIASALMAGAIAPPSALAAPPSAGQHSRWTLAFRAGLQGQGGAQPGAVSLEGEWHRTVVAVRPDSYDVRFQPAGVRLAGAPTAVDPAALAQATRRLATPVWATCGRDGSLQVMHFPKGMSASDRNLLQMVATETQFVQADAAQAVWTSLERDGGGSYFAIYQRRDATHVRKKKLRYLPPEPGGSATAAALQVTIESSELAYGFAPDGTVATVDGAQSIRLGVPGMTGNSLLTRVEVHLGNAQTNIEVLTATSLVPASGVDDLPVATVQTAPADALADMDAEMIEGRRSVDLLAAAGTADPTIERRLAALFRRRPESIPMATALIAAGTSTQVLENALADAGTTVAIDALRALAHETARSVAIRVGALMALEGLREPSADAMRTPPALLDDVSATVREAARLSAGALARAGRAAHQAEADAIEADLASRYARANTPDGRRAYLAALGNSAGPRAAAVMNAAIGDPREDIRMAAARGLRLVPGDATDSRLAAAARKDASASVRDAALFAIGFRRPLSSTLWTTVKEAARTDPAEAVRNRAIGMLRADTAHRQDAASTLSWVATHDSSEALRRLAAANRGTR